MDESEFINASEEDPNPQEEDGGEERGEGEAADPQVQPSPDLSVLKESSAEDTVHENQKTSEDMNDQESGPEDEDDEEEEEEDDDEEEEELFVLDPEHPLARKRRAAYIKVLRAQGESLDLALKQKLELLKAEENHKEEISCQMFRKQEQLARQRQKLMDGQEATARAQSKHQRAQEQLQETSSQYDLTSKEHGDAENSVSRLQDALDKLTRHLLSTQDVSEDLSSKVKTLHNVARNTASRRTQAEEQKLKQDYYVERLTVELQRLTEQKSMLEVHIRVQSEETEDVKESLSKVDMNMEVLMMMQKQLTQQWKSSLLALRRQDEACGGVQDAVRDVEHKLALVRREMEGYRKSIAEEEEKNETLTMQLKRSELDGDTSRRLIAQKQNQREGLLSGYRTLTCTLKETELLLDALTEETRTLRSELNGQRKQAEKNMAARLEQEDRIMTHLQQKLSHANAAKFSKRLSGRMAALRKEKRRQLVQKENELLAERLAIQQVEQRVSVLTFTREALEDQITKQTQAVTLCQNQITSLNGLVKQNQAAIANYNSRIGQIVASTGEDLSPMHIKIRGIAAQGEELAAAIMASRQQWMKQQDVLVGLSQKLEAARAQIRRLQTESTALQQREIRLDGRSESQRREADAIATKEDVLHRDRTRLCSLLSRNQQLGEALRQENATTEADFTRRLKEAELQAARLQVKHEKTQEDRDLLLGSLLEAEQQLMLWERKTQLMKETQAALDTEWGKEERQRMKADVHRKEVQLGRLMKQQAKLLKDGDVALDRWVNYLQRGRVRPPASPGKTLTRGALDLRVRRLQRHVKDTYKSVSDCNEVMKQLQQRQEDLSVRIQQQRQRITELRETDDTLNFDLVDLQDSKDTNLSRLLALQGRRKRLQGVCAGSYQASSTHQSVAAALRSVTERLHGLGSVLQRVCDEFPQHQGALRRLSQALAAHTGSRREEEVGGGGGGGEVKK